MRKKIFFAIAIVALIVIAIGLYFYFKPHTDVGNRKPDITINATELYAHYQQDEKLANEKYLGKIILVTGKVDDISRTDSSLVIQLNAGAGAGGINCNVFIHDKEKMPLVNKGSSVSIKGKCVGFLMDVNLVDCVFEK